jgi:hypothetical protein
MLRPAATRKALAMSDLPYLEYADGTEFAGRIGKTIDDSTEAWPVPKGGMEGVIIATGGNTGGYSLFVQDNKLHFTYNYLTRKFFRIVADGELSEGDLTILYEFEVTGNGGPSKGNGAPGTGTLYVNDEKVGSVEMDVTVPFLFSIEGLSVGQDYGDSVDHANYKPPFPFTGNLDKVTIDLSGDAIENAEAETRRGMSHQ